MQEQLQAPQLRAYRLELYDLLSNASTQVRPSHNTMLREPLNSFIRILYSVGDECCPYEANYMHGVLGDYVEPTDYFAKTLYELSTKLYGLKQKTLSARDKYELSNIIDEAINDIRQVADNLNKIVTRIRQALDKFEQKLDKENVDRVTRQALSNYIILIRKTLSHYPIGIENTMGTPIEPSLLNEIIQELEKIKEKLG